MNKKLFFILFGPFVFAQAPAGYYNGTENLKGYQLKNTITHIITKGSISRDYADLVKKYYQYTDLDHYYDHGKENQTYLLDIYTEIIDGPEVEYTIGSVTSGAGEEGKGINREHMIPQSTFDGLYPMFSDLHTVIPADAHINGRRSNYPYGIVGDNLITTFKNGGKLGKAAIEGYSYTGSVYEPINEFKGDVARTLLYYVVRYAQKLPFLRYDYYMASQGDVNPMDGSVDRGFDAAYIDMLKNWHELDPVSEREIDRNNAVYNIQGNRNPFIDNPEWVNVIWNDETDGIAPNAPQNFQVSMSAHYAKLTWDENPSALGYKVFLGSNLEIITHGNVAYIDRLKPNQEYNFKVVAYDGDFIDSEASLNTSTTLSQDEFASDLIISKYIEGTGSNKAIEIANRTGHPVNLNNYRFRAGGNYMYEYIDLEGTINHNETIVLMHPDSDLTCLNPKNATIISDTPSLKFEGSNYVELSYTDNVIDAMGTYKADNSAIMENTSLYRNLDSVLNPTKNFNLTEWTSHGVNYCEGLQQTLSTSDYVVKNQIKIYPNPTSDFFYIGKDLANEVIIFDVSGKMVLKAQQIQKGESINIQNLSSGIYFVVIDGLSYKLIKK